MATKTTVKVSVKHGKDQLPGRDWVPTFPVSLDI